jgi:hypothetical protein
MDKFFATVVLFLGAGEASATSCLMPDARQDFSTSKVVVAAEVRAVSVTPNRAEPGKFRQTVLWRVHESWKGPYTYGRDFTTRTSINCPKCTPYKLSAGRLLVLYLSGSEPYVLPWCSRTNFLERSLKDVPLLYRLAGIRHGT